MRKIGALLLVGMMTVMLFAGISSSPVAPEEGATISTGNSNPTLTYTLPITADSFTSAAQPNTNYGGQGYLLVSSNTAAFPTGYQMTEATSYLDFNLSLLPENIEIDSASLCVYNQLSYVDQSTVNPDGGCIAEVQAISDPWLENGITYNTAPATYGGDESIVVLPRNTPYNISEQPAANQQINYIYGWIEIPVAQILRDWIGNPAFHGLAIFINPTTVPAMAILFSSSGRGPTFKPPMSG